MASLLDSHPDIACWDDEPFMPGGAFRKSGRETPAAFLQEMVFGVNAQAVGFKLLWDAMRELRGAWRLFVDLGIELVHVRRRNLLDAYISLQLARLNNAFTSHQGAYDRQRIAVDYGQCSHWLSSAMAADLHIRTTAAEMGIRRLEIEYEAFCGDQTAALDFLRVPRCPLTSRLGKQRCAKQSAIISNYAQLKARFVGTQWHAMFDD